MTTIKKSNLPAVRLNNQRALSKKTLFIIFCCILVLVLIHGHNVEKEHKQKISPSLRSTTTHLSSEAKITTDDVNKNIETPSKSVTVKEETIEKEDTVDETAVQYAVSKAMTDMSNAVKDEFLVTMDWMHDAIAGTKKSISRSMDYFLKEYGNYTESEIELIDNEVANKVEEKLEADLMELVNKAVSDANKDLESLVKSEVDEKYDSKEIEKDVDTIRSYYVERLKAEVDSLEGELEEKIHGVSQEVEKKVLEEKVGLTESNKELDDREMKSLVTEKEDEVFKSANEKAVSLTKDINEAEENLLKGISEALTKFLVEKKKVSGSQAEEIEKNVEQDLDYKIKTILGQEIQTLEDDANTEADEVRDIATEDLSVIESAKKLGMAAGDTSTTAIIETSLNTLKAELENSFNDLVQSSKSRVIQRIKESTKDIENNVLKENGIDISDKELEELVEKELESLPSTDENVD